jgi:molybdopterin synthase catalytic subunit
METMATNGAAGKTGTSPQPRPEAQTMCDIDIRVSDQPFDPWTLQADLHRARPGIGALASFVGLMRDRNDGASVQSMTLEHYPGMTELALSDMAREAAQRFGLDAVRIVHRVGRVQPENPIVLVAVTAAHRGEAFRGCEFLMDYLKTRAPFWKKEQTDGGERWVDARESDDEAAARWNS